MCKSVFKTAFESQSFINHNWSHHWASPQTQPAIMEGSYWEPMASNFRSNILNSMKCSVTSMLFTLGTVKNSFVPWPS